MSQLPDIVLIIQTVGFIALLSGVYFAKKIKMQPHIKLTQISVFLAMTGLLWMGFSLVTNINTFLGELSGFKTSLKLIHFLTGSIALIAGMSFVFNKGLKKNKTSMRTLFTVWAIAFLMGVLFYISYSQSH